MELQDLQGAYARSPQVKALKAAIGKKSMKTIRLEGLLASSATVVFSSVKTDKTLVFVLQDAEEAGYFYHDLTQQMGESRVLFFPSSYKRAIRYGQKDPASEILRTEVLSQLSHRQSLFIVTYPEALAEMVVTRKQLNSNTVTMEQGQTIETEKMLERLRELGFNEVDYVYEPGQFALRGSILDVFSYSSEYPFRIDFFGDEIDSIRTFEVENQLSKERCQQAVIVPELTAGDSFERESLLRFLPDDAMLVFKNENYVREAVERAWQEGFSEQAKKERLEYATELEAKQIEKEMKRENHIISGTQYASDTERFRRILLGGVQEKRDGKDATEPEGGISFKISPQPLFHKNFDLLTQTLEDYLLKGYKFYVLADSPKQIERLKEIIEPLLTPSALSSPEGGTTVSSTASKVDAGGNLGTFTGVNKTLHEGYVDHDLRLCLFTDHQICDRFH